MVWGLGQPGADHWRQWWAYRRPIGLKRGHNVTKTRIFAQMRTGLRVGAVYLDHEAVVTKGRRWPRPSRNSVPQSYLDSRPPAVRRRARQPYVSFDRRELNTILNLYGRKVAAGEWRDYAIDFLKDRALFSIYRRASERPVYVIEKNPKLRNRQGQYIVTIEDGRVLKRGHELENVLRVLELAVVG